MEMARILVVFHSQAGHTQQLAEAVARGAAEMEDTEVIIKKAFETTGDDLIASDGLVIGSPEYFGYMAGAIKDLFDRTYEALRGHRRIFRKPYCIVIGAGNDGQGALNQIEKICVGYQFKKVQNPIVSVGQPTGETLARCEDLGRTIAAGCEAGIY
jgi:multimeric flavodoxin WrbA